MEHIIQEVKTKKTSNQIHKIILRSATCYKDKIGWYHGAKRKRAVFVEKQLHWMGLTMKAFLR